MRPPEYIEDVRERELEIAAAEARLADMDHLPCPYCDFDIEKSFLRCPSCLRRLKEPCATCGKPLDPRWKICPYCEAEVGRSRAPATPAPGRHAPEPAAAQAARHRVATGSAAPSATARAPREPDARKDRLMDRTLILVKPDAFERSLTGEIIARFERKGLRIVALKHMRWTATLAERALRRARGASRSSASSSTSSPAARWSRWCSRATRPSSAARQVIGATNPLEARAGSIRGDFALEVADEPGARLRLARVRRARERRSSSPSSRSPVLRRSLPARRSGARSSSSSGSSSGSSRADVEELTEGDPREVVVENALRKARAVRRASCVLGADTEVFLDGRIFGKPARREEARAYLARCPAARTRCWGGIALREADGERTGVAVTRGHASASSSERDLDWYLATGEWRDRAGALRDPGPRGGAGRARSRATTGTSSACPCRAARAGPDCCYPD